MLPYVNDQGLHCTCGNHALEVYRLTIGYNKTLQVRCPMHAKNCRQIGDLLKVNAALKRSCLRENQQNPAEPIFDSVLYTKRCTTLYDQLTSSLSPEILEDSLIKNYALRIITNHFPPTHDQ